jgi:RimJ/RimL family protein N-acetyltransferase
MDDRTELDARLGTPVPDWTPPPAPAGAALAGRYAQLARLDPAAHGPSIWRANAADRAGAMWAYLPYGPFATPAAWQDWAREAAAGQDPLFYAIRAAGADGWSGVASLMRIAPAAGSIEVGHIALSPALQQTRAATEAIFLLMRWVFEAGYRRFEWKCNALNLASRRAAERFGFSYEGLFRQALVVKGRNRDTAWFACIDKDWPALRAAYETWLDPANFDAEGRQRQALSALTRPLLVARDPALA